MSASLSLQLPTPVLCAGGRVLATPCVCVTVCTFVPVKHVKWVYLEEAEWGRRVGLEAASFEPASMSLEGASTSGRFFEPACGFRYLKMLGQRLCAMIVTTWWTPAGVADASEAKSRERTYIYIYILRT